MYGHMRWTRRAVVWPAALLGGSVVGLALHLVLFALGAAVLRAVGELGTAFPAAPSLVAMTSVVVRAFTMLLAGSLVATASGSSSAIHAQDSWTEARFRTGCEPGPFHEPPPPEHLETRFPPLGTEPNSALVRVDLGELSPAAPRPILGTGFNLEHALWSCPEFRGLFRSEVLDAFQPAI